MSCKGQLGVGPVRRLRFEESILDLNDTEAPADQKGDRLAFCVFGVSSTERQEYVRKWVEAHWGCGFGNWDLANGLCTVTVGSKTVCEDYTERDGHAQSEDCQRQRAQEVRGTNEDDRVPSACGKGLNSVNTRENMVAKRGRDACSLDVSRVCRSYKHRKAKENVPWAKGQSVCINTKGREENRSNKCTRESLSPRLKRSKLDRSPVFSRDSHSFKRKCKKPAFGDYEMPLNPLSRCTDINAHSISAETSKLNLTEPQSNLRITVSTKKSKPVLITDPGQLITEDTRSLQSQNSADLFSDEQSNSTNPLPRDAADNVNTSIGNNGTITADVENTDIRDAESFGRNPPEPHTNSVRSEASANSDTTRFSPAERRVSGNSIDDPGTRIPESAAGRINVSRNESSFSISTATSPPREDSSALIEFKLLDSVKKKRKPKRGSLGERLQSLISSQTSFLRIWRHRIRRSKENQPRRVVTVRVKEERVQFARQFFHGTVLSDPFNLLPSRAGGSHESLENTGRLVTLMTIPEIIGRVRIKPGSLLQVAEPWDVLDDQDLVINAAYVNAVPPGEGAEGSAVEGGPRAVRVVKGFHCDCMRVNRLLFTCRTGREKPDVMEEIFPRI